MKEKIKNQPVILNEHYEIEFIEDSGSVYEPGDQMDAFDFIDEYCQCNSSELQATTNWLKDIQVPEAVAFIAAAWGISYKLHHIKTIDQIIN